MAEKNYVVNVKTKLGTIITVRGDSAEELDSNIDSYIDRGISAKISILENDIIGGGATAPDPIAMVSQALGATVVEERPSFAPVPPPNTAVQPTVAGSRVCVHGTMTGRKGQGAKGEWKGFFCPAPNKQDQCTPQWLNRKDAEWNAI